MIIRALKQHSAVKVNPKVFAGGGDDPGFAPGVGTPEPFGMTPYEVLQTINFFADRIVGFDCVEVCPPHDNGNTSALAARLIRHLVGAVWQSQERFK